MWSPTLGQLAVFAALHLFTAGLHIARATPLSNGFSVPANDARSARSLSESEIVNTGTFPPDDGIISPQITDGVLQNYLKGASGDSTSAGARDSIGSFDLGTNAGTPFEVFRSLINVPKDHAQRIAPRKGAPADDGLTLGPEAREWVDDAVRGIVHSVIELRTNEQGRTTFSVLGMGDFGVMMSADRNELALVTGDDVLLTAHRAPLSTSAQGGGAGFQDTSAAGYLSQGSGDYSLQRVIDTLQETATHPLSMLFFAIVIAFVVLWQILNAQAIRRPAAHPRMHQPDLSPTASRRSPGKHRSRRTRRG